MSIRLSLPLAALLLAGCASTAVAPDPLKAAPAPGHSAVAVSITANTGQIRGFDELRVRRVGAQEFHVLRQVAPGMARDTTLFVGVLPPGEYEFFSMRDNGSQKLLALSPQGIATIGSFVVGGGQPVDLGRLLITPVNSNFLYGRAPLAGDNRRLMARFAPAYLRLFGADVQQGWRSARLAQDRVQEYAAFRPVGADCIQELPDGSVVAASRLGAVLQRSAAGSWQVLRSPGLESLLCVLPVQLPDADLLAVGELGTLLRRAPGASTLQAVDTGNLPPGSVLRIAGNASAGWYVALLQGDLVTIFHSPVLERGEWKPLRSERLYTSNWYGASQFWMWPTAQGLAYTASEGPLHLLDFASGKWSERATPHGWHLADMRSNPDGSLSVLALPPGADQGSAAFLSVDMGQSWQQLTLPFGTRLAPPQRTMDGTLLAYGGNGGRYGLQASRDGGRNWAGVAELGAGRVLFPLKSGGLLDTDMGQHGVTAIMFSPDGGRTWQTEYTNYNPKAADF